MTAETPQACLISFVTWFREEKLARFREESQSRLLAIAAGQGIYNAFCGKLWCVPIEALAECTAPSAINRMSNDP